MFLELRFFGDGEGFGVRASCDGLGDRFGVAEFGEITDLDVHAFIVRDGEKEEILENFQDHDDDSPLLIGHLKEDDKVREAKQESFADRQILLF